jgi:hypothetical protein
MAMGHCDDLDRGVQFPIDDQVGKAAPAIDPRPVEIGWPLPWSRGDPFDSATELSQEPIRHSGAPPRLPAPGCPCFGDRPRIELKRYRGIDRVFFPDQAASFGPGYGLNASFVEIGEAPLKLSIPGQLHLVIAGGRVEAVDQTRSQVASFLIRQAQGLLE